MNTMPTPRLDLLRLPVVGRLLTMRYGRLLLQLPFLVVALLLIYDGFTGETIASQNLATVTVWVHYRAFLVVALLLVGNVFCMGCPFTLPRTLAKRLSRRGGRFPRWLRSKWLAIFNLFALFFAYEWLDLWASPAMTAWVIIAYFVASFALEAWFNESAFCKYVCPLGAFNFAYSTLAPTQIQARNPAVCADCVGRECINGSYSPSVIALESISVSTGEAITHRPQGALGCGTLLFVPQIKSNTDCTLCLDCARACPHDNIALIVRPHGQELQHEEALPKRYDAAFVYVALAFIGIVNAFGMVPPVYDLMQSLAEALQLARWGLGQQAQEAVVLLILFAVGGILLPMLWLEVSGWLALRLTRARLSLREVILPLSVAFVPLGFGIWVAHYSYHFLTGFLTIVPIFHNFLIQHGITAFGTKPQWALGGVTELSVIGTVQLIALLGGFLWSLSLLQRHSTRLFKRQAVVGMLPFAFMLLGLVLVAVWIFSLPMEMRGTVYFD